MIAGVLKAGELAIEKIQEGAEIRSQEREIQRMTEQFHARLTADYGAYRDRVKAQGETPMEIAEWIREVHVPQTFGQVDKNGK